MEEEDEEANEQEGYRYVETPRGALLEVTRVGGGVPPPEENADLPVFTPEHAHLFFLGAC